MSKPTVYLFNDDRIPDFPGRGCVADQPQRIDFVGGAEKLSRTWFARLLRLALLPLHSRAPAKSGRCLKLMLWLALASLYFTAQARPIRFWSDAELERNSDLIVIAMPLTNADLLETNSLGWSSGPSFQPRFRGVETAFRVLDVFKGMPANDKIVVHHYRMEPEWGCPPDGPTLRDFACPTTNRWLLYLVKDGTNRYAAVTGQIDPFLSFKIATNLPPRFMLALPLVPPIADADPAIRHPVSIRVPTRLKILRTTDTISAETDTNSLESEMITVGTNMATG